MEFELKDYALIIIPFVMWLSAQIVKFIIFSLKHGIDWKYLFEYGHMPSSHTACVSALAFVAGYYEGIGSAVFGLAFTWGLITIYDAVKLRAYIGEYGKTLNRFFHETGKNGYPRLKERVGHTTEEVVTGAVFGVVGAWTLALVIEAFSL